jgi:NDP-sugar pyrophosphorylase family protein
MSDNKKIKVVILAAGFGERLIKSAKEDKSLTEAERENLFTPDGEIKHKALLKINGREIVSRWIDQLREIAGLDLVEDVYLVTNDKYHQFFLEWAQREDIGLSPDHIFNNGVSEVGQRKGAVADLALAAREAKIENYTLVLSSDTLFDEFKLKDLVAAREGYEGQDILPVYQEKSEVMKRRAHISFGDDRRVTGFQEKPQDLDSEGTYWASPAVYLYSRETMIKYLPEYVAQHEGDLKKVDAPGQFNEALYRADTEMRALPIKGKRFDIGNLEGLRMAETYFRAKEGERKVEPSAGPVLDRPLR